MAENIINKDLISLFRGEPTPFSNLGRTENNMLKGRFFSPDPELARGFAQRPGGVIRSMDVTPTQLSDTMKFKSGLKYNKGFDWLNPNKDVVVASKKLLSEAKPSINWGQTLKHNIDVSKMLAETYGKQGLGFLKQNAFRTLAMLGTLPAQAGLMTLAPTKMGNAEIILAPNQNQGSSVSQESRENAGSGYSRSDDSWSSSPFANGGIVNLYKYGGFI